MGMPTITEIGRHIFPFFRPETKLRPGLLGTAVFCSVAEHPVALTAAHVLDQNDETIYFTDGDALEVAKEDIRKTAMPASGDREDDKVDLAAFRLTAKQAAALTTKKIMPIPLDQWNVDDRLIPSKHYVFSGFPASRTQLDYAEKKIMARGISANCITASPKDFPELGFDRWIHIMGLFDRENMADSTGARITAPVPWGMSGGAIWTLRPGSDDYALVGINTRYLAKANFLIGTRLNGVVALLGSFPEFVPYLPRPAIQPFTVSSVAG
jgi:hypothetical protein